MADVSKANAKIIGILVVVVIAMFGFGFAMVPLYDMVCDALGINGKTGGPVAAAQHTVDKNRLITIEFVANNNENLPWAFKPNKVTVKLHPGQNTRISYFAKNNSNKTMTVQAIPSVAPGYAAKYMKKTECFCFNRQTLKAGESMDMPVLFHIDSDLPKNVNTLTLSYTLFDVESVKTKSDQKQGKIS